MDIGGAGEAKDEDAALLQKTTVMTVIPDTSMTVTMDVDELDIAYYEPGQKADILVDALPNQSFTAVVEEVSAVGKNSGGNFLIVIFNIPDVDILCDGDLDLPVIGCQCIQCPAAGIDTFSDRKV